MKIQSIETYTQGALSMVRVQTDDGQAGWGQCAPFNADITALVLHRQIAPEVLGHDADDLDGISDRCIERNHKFPWSYVCRALAGVDTALWDLRGKRLGRSVRELLGGTASSVRAYGSSMRRDITPEDEAARMVRLRDSHGFTAFKMRAGTTCGHNEDAWPGRTEALIPTVREALGEDIAMLVDGNSCYTPDKAIEVGRMLQDNGVCHFEEPCPYGELEWTRQVTAALDRLDVTGGEQDVDLAQWRRMIGMRAVDIVQPDVCYVGGLTRAMRVAEMAEQAGMVCVPHSANLSLVTLFALHLMAAIPNAGPYMEFTIENNEWTHDLFAPALRVSDGRVAVPQGPGWGVEISPAWLERADREVSTARR
jgi:L-alanine-DL-glutamate epimerase-like enolase superfamily enzyme